MVKKSLIAIVLMGLLASTSFAGDKAQSEWKFDNGWPAEIEITFETLELCQIPVYIDVGMYVELIDCGKKKIILEQLQDCSYLGTTSTGSTKFPCYRGCTDIEVRANFEAKLGTKMYKVPNSFISQRKSGFNYYDNWNGFFVHKDTDTDVDDDLASSEVKSTWLVPGDGSKEKMQICVEAWDVNIFLGDPDVGPTDAYTDDPNDIGTGIYDPNQVGVTPNFVGEVAVTVVPTAVPDICDYVDCD
jgi:hypothetical protein